MKNKWWYVDRCRRNCCDFAGWMSVSGVDVVTVGPDNTVEY